MAHRQLQVHLFNCSSIVILPPIYFNASVSETCQIIYTFAYTNKTILGFDPTINLFPSQLIQQPSPLLISTIKVNGAIHDTISILWTSHRFVGHCTNIFHVRPHGVPRCPNNQLLDKYDYAIKDVWLEENLVDYKCSILEHITDIEGVPKLVKAWSIQYNGKDDTTLCQQPSQWDLKLTPRYVTHVHRHL